MRELAQERVFSRAAHNDARLTALVRGANPEIGLRVSASLIPVIFPDSVYFTATVAVVWVGVPFTVSTIGTAVPAVAPAGTCRLNCCSPSVAPGVFPA